MYYLHSTRVQPDFPATNNFFQKLVILKMRTNLKKNTSLQATGIKVQAAWRYLNTGRFLYPYILLNPPLVSSINPLNSKIKI